MIRLTDITTCNENAFIKPLILSNSVWLCVVRLFAAIKNMSVLSYRHVLEKNEMKFKHKRVKDLIQKVVDVQ